jgi:hypothetical protein
MRKVSFFAFTLALLVTMIFTEVVKTIRTNNQ